MPTLKKVEEVKRLKEDFERANLTMLMNFNQLDGVDMTLLRRQARLSGSRLKVLKNTLARRAVEGTVLSDLQDRFNGPVAALMVFDSEGIAGASKALLDFMKERSEKIEILCASLEGSYLDAADAKGLANLPTRGALQSLLLGALQAPARNFVSLLNAVPRSFLNLLLARVDSLCESE